MSEESNAMKEDNQDVCMSYVKQHETSTSALFARARQLARALGQSTPTPAQLVSLMVFGRLTPPPALLVSQLASLGTPRQTETPISEMKRKLDVLQASLGGMDEEEDEEDVAPKFGYEKWTSIGRS